MKKHWNTRLWTTPLPKFDLKMKLTTLLLFTALFGLQANNGYSQKTKISLDVENMSVGSVIDEIESTTDFRFVYITKFVDIDRKVSLHVKQQPIHKILSLLFDRTDTNYTVEDTQILLTFKDEIQQTSKEKEEIGVSIAQAGITGKVTDTKGVPLPGASIVEKGTTNGIQADFDGNFSLNVVTENAILIVSYIGFATKEIATNGQSTIEVVLEETADGLDEVVVIGYGKVKKSDLTGSVAQISSENVTAFPTTNVMQAIQGRAAGVQVSQSTGAPGADVIVRIRGSNSVQGNNEPLYVIDGFPYSGSPTNLSNSDIESIEVLKDASATSIYGSRGANGVVLITTKEGKSGVIRVDYETSYTVQKLRSKLDLLNGREYAQFVNLQRQNDNIDPFFSQEEINSFREGFDWQDFVFREAPIKSHSLNVSGGNEKTRFSLGGNVFDQEGIIKGSDFKRFAIRINLEHEISEKVSVKWSNSLSFLDTKRQDSGGGSRGSSLIGAAISAPPLSSPFNDDGSFTIISEEFPFVPPDMTNPINFLNAQRTENKSNIVLSNIAVIYNPIPDLTVKISGGIENRDERNDSYRGLKFWRSNGEANVSTNQFRSLLSENIINYEKTFNDKHRISALAGFTYQDFVNTSLSASATGFLSDVFETGQLEAAANPGIPNTGFSKSVLQSYLGRINYAFDDKYLFTLSVRSDGSSRFPDGNKWGTFPSAAFAWNAYKENYFIENLDIFSDFKIRASWGLTGSQAIAPFTTLNLLNSGQVVFDDSLFNTFAPGRRLPGDLEWETTEQLDFGIDLGFFDNRLSLTADYYKKNTDDLLNTVNLPSSTGFISTIRNVGEVENKGFEIGLNAKLFTGEFKWNLSGNISTNRNKVIKLNDGQDILTSFVGVLVVQDNVSILKEGSPIGQFWGFLEDGLDENGQIIIQDLDGDGSISADDKTFIGDPNPDFTYGVNSNMSYKNFDLSLFIQGSQGNDIFNASAIPVTMDFGQGVNTLREVFLDNWNPSNLDAKYPLVSTSTSAFVSDRWVEDGSYVRLKNIELAYSIPIDKSVIRKAQIYISGQNLITLTDYSWWDPEVNSQGGNNPGIDFLTYPIAKSFTLGLRMGF